MSNSGLIEVDGKAFADFAQGNSDIWLEMLNKQVLHGHHGIGEITAIWARGSSASNPEMNIFFESLGTYKEYRASEFRRGSFISVQVPVSVAQAMPIWRAAKLKQKRFTIAQRKLSKLQSKLTEPLRVNVYVTSNMIRKDDLRLCLAWDGQSVSGVSTALREFRQKLSDYQSARLLSARIAELAAAEFYSSLGLQVRDISITQLDHNASKWKSYDLLVDKVPIDVKNARRAFSSPESYVQHCIPTFKADRLLGTEVRIAGVLSDYVKDSGDLIEGTSQCLMLGEMTKSYMRTLYSYFVSRYGGVLTFDGMWHEGFQPGWCFEYSPKVYADRQLDSARCREVLMACFDANIELESLGWLLSLGGNEEALSEVELPIRGREVLRDIWKLRDKVGLSRPSVFLYVMAYMLERIVEGEPTDGSVLRKFMFLGRTNDKDLLGLYDPQGFISNLINNLSILGKQAINSGLHFNFFKMTHPSILVGRLASGKWITVVAYCGGWLEKPVLTRCGKTPLVLGQNKSCPQCAKLICDDCGFCSENCTRERRVIT